MLLLLIYKKYIYIFKIFNKVKMGNIFNKSNKLGLRFRIVVFNYVVGLDIFVKNKNYLNCDYRSNRIKIIKYFAFIFLLKNLFE